MNFDTMKFVLTCRCDWIRPDFLNFNLSWLIATIDMGQEYIMLCCKYPPIKIALIIINHDSEGQCNNVLLEGVKKYDNDSGTVYTLSRINW